MFNTEKVQYKTATLYSSVFSYSLCCFAHAENNCSATWWPRAKELKEHGSNTLCFFLKGLRDAATCIRKWKPSRLIWVPLPTPATKETSGTAQRKGWSRGEGSYSPWQDVNLPLFEDALREKELSTFLWAPQLGFGTDTQPEPCSSNPRIPAL